MSVARDLSQPNRTEKEFTATTQVVNSTELPGADPHARWCGRGAVSRPPIPIPEEFYLFNSLLDLPNPTLLQKILDQPRFPNSPVWHPRVICLKFDLLMGK